MSDVDEIWKDIKGFEGFYQVSNLGQVKSLAREMNNRIGGMSKERQLKPGVDSKGYYFVNLHKDKIKHSKLVHLLVANAFIENVDNKPDVDHKDNNRSNNNVLNLRYATKKENGMNRTKSLKCSSIYKGVHWNEQRQKWQTHIKVNNKQTHLGCFDNDEGAGLCYDWHALLYFGDFAKYNLF
jgi:hypothetical protein